MTPEADRAARLKRSFERLIRDMIRRALQMAAAEGHAGEELLKRAAGILGDKPALQPSWIREEAVRLRLLRAGRPPGPKKPRGGG